MARRQLDAMVRLVDDLMDVSRITRGKVVLRPERVALADVVARAVETSRPAIDACGHAFTMELPASPVWLEVDVTRMAQVLSNLLNNAAKYCDRGGRVHLSAAIAPATGERGREVVIRVADTGIGIAPEALSAIFEPFMQAARSLERSHGGLGIGLSLVKRLVELHGGHVEAHSDGPGRGSEFVVSLPLPEQAPPSPVPERASAAQTSGGRRALVVDDNRDSALTMTVLLRKMGNEVRTAYDGEEAVAVAASMKPDLVLLDIGLPKLDGFEVARRIRAAPGGDAVTLIALTGWGQEEDRRRSKDAGFDHHLVKPVDPKMLARVVAEVRRGPSVETR
jgi:CheY-like chemotaxis protein